MDWLVEKSLRRRFGHLRVKSNGHTFATDGFDAHIGSHFPGFWAGLHSEVRATNEKMPNMSGQRVRFFGLMAVNVMMELVATNKCMKMVVKQEGELLVVVVVVNTPAVAVTITPATAGAPGGAVANHENEKEGSAAREKAGQRVFSKEGGWL